MSSSDPGPRKPPYPQEEATRWLGALARGIQRHGQTVFLIEQLQPSWLPARIERCAYVLASRLLEGTALAMIAVAIFSQVMDAEWLRGLVYSLAFAAIFAAVDLLRLVLAPRGPGQALARWQAAAVVAAAVLAVAGTAEGLGQKDGWLYALFGLASGPAWAKNSAPRSLVNDVQPVETTRWSWRSGLAGGTGTALVAGALLIAASALSLGEKEKILEALSLSAPFVTLMAVIDAGLRPHVVELKTHPNQGIRLSFQNAALLAGTGLGAGLLAGLLKSLWKGHWQSAVSGLVLGSLCGLFLALLKGGVEVLRHGILRLLLVRRGSAPRRPADFFDYAAGELHFLQKVGGGYMFIHRSLQEYFASLEA
jgi:hypothetical protein